MIENKESLQKSYNKFFDELPEDIKEVLEEMSLSERTAMPELLKWHKRYLLYVLVLFIVL